MKSHHHLLRGFCLNYLIILYSQYDGVISVKGKKLLGVLFTYFVNTALTNAWKLYQITVENPMDQVESSNSDSDTVGLHGIIGKQEDLLTALCERRLQLGWVVLFSHPADFTPVCTTELGRMAVHDLEFKKRNVKLLALSCDKMQSHLDWVNDIKSYCPDIKTDFPYPIIADESRELAVLLDMISEDDKNKPELAMTVRALYIVSPDHKLRLSMVYPTSTGRNVDEILRCIDSLQLCARVKCVATPANWTPGTKVMILPHVKDEDLPKLFPKGIEKVSMPSGVNYVRTTTDY